MDKQAFCHWISVDDALPDAGDRVIATDGDFVGEAYMIKRAGNSPNWMRHYGCSWVGGDVIAWAPMPLYDRWGRCVPPHQPGAGQEGVARMQNVFGLE